MKKRILGVVAACAAIIVFTNGSIAQKGRSTPKPIIFAILDDGGTLEPIAYVNKRKLEAAVNGEGSSNAIAAFNRAYYKKGTAYKLIFGGAPAGTVSVKSSDHTSDCSKNLATVVAKPSGAALKGFVMGLATNAASSNSAKTMRRKPTAAEKAEIEALVKAEFTSQKLTPNTLRFHNLTAIDAEGDERAELVGSYWTEIDSKTRGLLFFIAAKNRGGKYAFGYKEYRALNESDVMSGDIGSVDSGTLHELLLDTFDYDGDGVREVFTYTQSFEGAGFHVYRREGGKWIQAFENYNYHCGY